MPEKKTEKKDVGLTVDKSQFAEWYPEVILKAELADYSPVKGCMIIRPNGYSIWEKIQAYFNARMKKLKVRNAYFPLFIPESFFKKEAQHAEGFTPEVAWIANREDERLAVRPTSETIMYDSYSKWVRSWRDLPLRINQWANVVRWETSAVKLFLRTREFLWQEGHCVYATKEECDQETFIYLNEYAKLSEELLAVPVIKGVKTEKEKFAGALYTTTIEGLMPDGKALQMGTSHQLGQGFAKSFEISFLGTDGKKTIPWQNSWGLSTRTIGAVVMTHGDNKGLVLPPKIAETHAVIVPIIFDETRNKVLEKCQEIKASIEKEMLKISDELSVNISVLIDDRDEYNPGWKFNEWELKGIPLRIEFGPKDLEKDQAILVRRDTGDKLPVPLKDIGKNVPKLLEMIQDNLYQKAKKFMMSNIAETDSMDEMIQQIEQKKMVKVDYCCNAECEESIKEKTGGATARCILLDPKMNKIESEVKCIHCRKKAKHKVLFAKAY
ncbi:proline--tRNA ligase [Candidatus Woesearchaeota archaeon]|nr:proline--tRNA ligase [Candidatus Woesearchaeota archaeon]